MKKIFFIAMICFSIGGYAQNKTDLKIIIDGYKSTNGNILIAVYNSEETYMKFEKVSFVGIAKPVEGKTEYVFKNIPDGVYAITMFHDENNNGKLDTNFFGIPKERNGFSNNAKGSFGPAKFKDAKFTHAGEQTISITLN